MNNTIQKQTAVNPKELSHVVDGLFNNTLRRFFDGNLWDTEMPGHKNDVPVNVRETDQQYEVDVIAPGCRKEEFRVIVQDNELQISFIQDDQKKQTQENAGWVRNEYVLRSFKRHFTLDETVDSANVSAAYIDGILRITLPKSEKAKPRALSVEVK
ncbi:Hsp20/alpha crystallin family protein [Terrimonas sp. NA20]|uniref:Hsp20/alpha crystallin family protein n=1 Tax=Terrimonas ginsenosidimutans TaxID=2908004 RepID=A0ABS9KSD1_9BACT|nr:Hsp20/alpha crystallin family protein [Terrimonas ginsenosidimutans]MCG2615220.1 Hsp20/alpha crystallin family protein [Terrimonas ginsenosidimutans]